MVQAIRAAKPFLAAAQSAGIGRRSPLIYMEFDWLDVSFDLSKVTPKEIEESFEDPFSVRLIPDGSYSEGESRYFCLGLSVNSRPLISVFWTDGKRYRVIFSRQMTKEEENFYQRRNAQII